MKYPILLCSIILCFFIHLHINSFAQCSSWSASTQIITTSSCAANGSFSVSLTGSDVANLSNIQYGIPIAANNYSVPLNNSPVFNNVPPGSYTVTVTATCGGNSVGKNTAVTIAGGYVVPTATLGATRSTLPCAYTGTIRCNIQNGVAPFTISIVNWPVSYQGPTSFQSSGSYTINNLPAGQYNIQVSDACGSGTPVFNASVGTVNTSQVADYDFADATIGKYTCDSLSISIPYIYSYSVYKDYVGDTAFKVSAKIASGILAPTPFISMYGSSGSFKFKLPAGMTIKDCYGLEIDFTIALPCGDTIHKIQSINAPYVFSKIINHCNVSMDLGAGINGLHCGPDSFTAINVVTNQTYGPQVDSNFGNLPIGTYSISVKTGDGYTASASAIPDTNLVSPYAVSIISGACGLNNFIQGFLFTKLNSQIATGDVYLELFNGPPGYSYHEYTYLATGNWAVYQNQSPTNGTNINFPAGYYVWKITDNCGVYYLPITVTQQDLFQFTIGIGQVTPTCQGTWVTPTGTATNNGQTVPIRFSALKDGNQYVDSISSNYWSSVTLGGSILLKTPGTYTFLPSNTSYPCTWEDSLSPNTSFVTYVYTTPKLQIDVNHTQGFLCTGGANGQAQIFTQALGGNPYNLSPAYKFFLAHTGNAVTGPYIDSNITGAFTNFGGNANDSFDVKVVDGCGAFSIQRVKIIDLGITRVISSSSYIFCSADSITLSAIYLPNATYSWTGPNGFTASQQTIKLYNVNAQNGGNYHVTITTPHCNGVFHDSTTLVVNPSPPTPVISYNCAPLLLTVVNPDPAYIYQWRFSRLGFNYISILDSGYTYTPLTFGDFFVWAIDTVSGCKTKSNIFKQGNYPEDSLNVNVYVPHPKICTGDTLTIVANLGIPLASYYGVVADYQWFKNGVPISGATNNLYVTASPGNYKVSARIDVCNIDTSDEVTISVTGIPTVSLTAPVTDFCQGNSVNLYATTDTSYSYSWIRNSSTVTGAFSPTLAATQSGSYYVIVSNGGCIAVSDTVSVTAHPRPDINLQPAGTVHVCPGETVHFATPANSTYSYNWSYNGQPIPNASSNSYNAIGDGTYKVFVSAPYCPNIPSSPVQVATLPTSIQLGKDTSLCDGGTFAMKLAVDATFQSILWSTGDTTKYIIISQSGLYWVSASNKCGTYTDTINVHTLADYQPALPTDTLICNSQNMAVLKVPQILTDIHWSNGSTTPQTTITAPGRYWVTASSPCGVLTDTVDITFCRSTITDILPDKDSLCEGDCISFSPIIQNYPATYRWYFEGGNTESSSSPSSGIVCYPKEGVYTVSLWIGNPGGEDSFSRTVTVFPKPQPRFQDTIMTVSYKTLIHIPACAAAVTVDWYIDDSLICHDCPSLNVDARYYKTRYRCIVSNSDCLDSCSYVLNVIDIPNDLWLPSAFTPNGDGKNDVFRIITDNPNIAVMDFSVYNRWGQEVFNNVLSTDGWNGTKSGTPAETGTYFWMLKYKVLGRGDVYFKKGDVTLIR